MIPWPSRWASLTASLLVACITWLGTARTAWAGAWTLPSQRWYVEYFYRYFGSKHVFDSEGNRQRRPTTAAFSDIRNELKLEYGLTDQWNVLASVPYLSSHYRDDNVDLLRTGAGDVFLRTKYRFLNRPLLTNRSPFVGSAQLSFKIPTYNPKRNPLGDGQLDVESRLLLSQSWLWGPEEAPVAQHGASSRTPAPGPITPLSAAPTSHEEAIRDAVLLAQLVQQGTRLYNAGRYAEAAQWFQAVLEHSPNHYEARRIVLTHAAQLLAHEQEFSSAVQLARFERVEPVDGRPIEPVTTLDPPATEIRYNYVAFVNLEHAFTARAKDPANEFPLFAELGLTPFKRLMLIGSLDAAVSVKSTNEEEENFAKWGLRGIVNLWGDGFASVFRTGKPTVNVEVGYNDVFAGRNTADAFEVFGKLEVVF